MTRSLSARVIDPDDYLETPAGRVFTVERSRQAWERAYATLSTLLPGSTRLYLVMGVQGAGKSTWIARHGPSLEPGALFFDAALPARRHRERLLALAREAGVAVVAVFVQARLQDALSRNAVRAADKVVPEQALRNVFSLLEAPSVEEGFDSVVLVGNAGNGKGDDGSASP